MTSVSWNEATIQHLTEMLRSTSRRPATGAGVTLKSLGGYAIGDYGYRLERHWRIGHKGKNTGTMLIVVPSEHRCESKSATG